MAVQQPPHPQFPENSAELITQVLPTDDTDDEPTLESAPPRQPPKDENPPRGATRSLGGNCPECGGAMSTRLRAEYGDDYSVSLQIKGFCHAGCGIALEGEMPPVPLERRRY